MNCTVIMFYNELNVSGYCVASRRYVSCSKMKHDILYQGVANNSWKSAWHDAAHILLLNLSESTCTMAHNLQTKVVQHVLTALLCLVSLHLIIFASQKHA